MKKTNRAKIVSYLILSFSVAIFISFYDPALQEKKLSPKEYILMEERLMNVQDTVPRLDVQTSGFNFVDSAYVTPSETYPSQKGSWTFTYIPKSGDFVSGGSLLLEVPFAFLSNQKSWTYPQISKPNLPGFVKVRSSNPETSISVARKSKLPFYYIITATFADNPLKIGDTLTFTYGDSSESLGGMATSNVHATAYEFRILTNRLGTNSWEIITPIPSIRVISNSAKRFQITVPSLRTIKDSVPAVIVALDEYNNMDIEYFGTLELSCFGGSDCRIPNTVVFDSADSGRVVVNFRPGEGKHQLLAKDSSGSESFSNPFIVSTAPLEYNLYWGDLQNHTEITDGNATIEDFYEYAQDVANIDFVALTDHDHTYGINYLIPDVWEKIRELARAHNRDGKFISFLGWEWTNENKGHKHIVYSGDEAEPYNHRTFSLPSDLWAALEGERALTISHHVAWGGRRVDWNYRNDKFQRIVEIYSQHGANEFLLNPLDHQASGERAPGHYVRDALAMGHKLGILASGDGHFGYPGNGWMWSPTALGSNSRGTGLTAIYAETLTRESLFDALVDRRVFGTTDHRTIVDFKVNGEWMGSEIRSDSIPLIQGSVLSHTPIKSVEIVKFNGMNYEISALELDGADLSFDFSFRDSLYVRSSFYYLRVTSVGNVNDRFAWSSPVWVDKPVLSELVELPDMNEYGFFQESDSSYKYEIGFISRSDTLPFSISGVLSFEAYNIRNSNEVSLFINGIFHSYLEMTDANNWGATELLTIPKYLVDSLNVIRFENTDALLDSDLSEWGVRNLRFSPQRIGNAPETSEFIGSYVLKHNFPNPFNPITTIEYSLPSRSDVSLIIFNIRGQEIARLVGEEKPAGTHTAKWNASNVASGIYFYRLNAGEFVQTKKMVLLK